MGTSIKKNKDGLYQLKSTVSNEVLHKKKWITEDDAKKVFIEKILWKAIEDIVCVEMDFPYGYFINGKMQIPLTDRKRGLEFILECYKSDEDGIYKKFMEVIKKHKLENFFTPITKDGQG